MKGKTSAFQNTAVIRTVRLHIHYNACGQKGVFIMKTMEELYKEVMASEELRKEFAEVAKTKEGAAEWLKKHGCNATPDEVMAFLKSKNEGEISDAEVEAVAGGGLGEFCADVLRFWPEDK
jgi:hypothetical protein